MATLTITVPDAQVPRITTAVRARFPDVTGNLAGQTPLADGPAVKAALIFLVRSLVSDYEGSLVKVGVDTQVSQAKQKAMTDLAVIT